MNIYRIAKDNWDKLLREVISCYQLYAPVESAGALDYVLIGAGTSGEIIYNTAKPVTPLKSFFLPFRQNVVHQTASNLTRVIMGVPACDLAALELLDSIYLDPLFPDMQYMERRNNTIIIGSDCYFLQNHCHCTVYDINPFPEKNCDLTLIASDGNKYLQSFSTKGDAFIAFIQKVIQMEDAGKQEVESIQLKRILIKEELTKKQQTVPGGTASKMLVTNAEHWFWKKHSKECVSCGACAVICPTCTCFLLSDRVGLEKVRLIDACQYPGFSRVAAGEDPLKQLSVRFSNRYMCKFVWKPDRFKVNACTGCGRCIEACIGKINKNEVMEDMAAQKVY